MGPSRHPPLGPGAQIGPYQIGTVLGEGGIGQVFLARDSRLGRSVAIKLIRTEFAERGDFRHRFEREARAISALNHPHICTLHDVGEQDGAPYLVMEYVEGEPLSEVLKAGPLPIDRVLAYAAEIADALAAAHAHGIVHRDLKPGNIMITCTGVKVLDFGLATQADGAVADGPTAALTAQTQDGRIMGTVAYMSPEQADGKPVDARSDMFSFGVLLYQMLCGQTPFRGDTTLSALAAILRENPESPRKIRHEIPEDVERIVLQCLAKKPESRYSSAKEAYRAISAYRAVKLRAGPFRRPVVQMSVAIVLIAVTALGVQAYRQAARRNWVETVALPQITQLLEKRRTVAALRLLRRATGTRLIAVERRIKTALLFSGGSFERVAPEVDSWNFAPRVKIPVLMLNGRDDFRFPLETSQQPLFKALGVPDKDKRLVLYEGGHDTVTRLEAIKEGLDWLDRYLKPVKTQ